MECPFCLKQTGAHSKQCKHCAKSIPPAQCLLEESGVVESTSSAPIGTTGKPAAGTQGRYRFARLGDRFIAFVLDTVFLFGLFAIADAWTFMRWGSVEDSELQLTTASLVIAITLNSTLLFLYGWLLETAWGATIGKAMVGIRVVGAGRHRSFSACALRNALRIIDGLGFYLVGIVAAACSPVRQRIGDMYARTAVIEGGFARSVRAAAVVFWITSLTAAGWGVPRICSANQFVRPRYLSEVIIRVGTSENSAYLYIGGIALRLQLAQTLTCARKAQAKF